MKTLLKASGLLIASTLMVNCSGDAPGGCSAVDLNILVQSGMLTNEVSARIVNNSDEARRVKVFAADPSGNSSTIGPVTIAPKGTFTQRLGPLMKSYGSSQVELESNGSRFEIASCE